MKSKMYQDVKTWNPFKGCLFDCVYCKPSFQAQAKRQKQNCINCYYYTPHYHPERLDRIPSADTVFVCGNGDISFCDHDFTRQIIERVRRRPNQTFYFQSKRPEYFKPFLSELPPNVILLTTLETNRDQGYRDISKAPLPMDRFNQFEALRYDRKVLTVEPLLDFDEDSFVNMIYDISPEYVWVGFNSRPKQVRLPEPSRQKVFDFIRILTGEGIELRGKELRGLPILAKG